MGLSENLFTGVKILEEVESKANGKIVVVKRLGFGTYIQVEGLTQSGSVVYDVWRSTLRKVKKSKIPIKNILILGLGGGSTAIISRKYWPNSNITGVDVDPVIVEMGGKYMGLGDVEMDIRICDGEKFVREAVKDKRKYDLVLIDMYVGYEVPDKFEKRDFLEKVRSLIDGNGLVVFNRLYFGEKRKLAIKFADKLEEIFPLVNYFYPEANIMFICKGKE